MHGSHPEGGKRRYAYTSANCIQIESGYVDVLSAEALQNGSFAGIACVLHSLQQAHLPPAQHRPAQEV